MEKRRSRPSIDQRHLAKEALDHAGFGELMQDLADVEIVRDKQLIDPEAARNESAKTQRARRDELSEDIAQLPPELES